MTVRTYHIQKPLLDLDMQLGEGCVWDSRQQRLYFVDIDKGVLYVYCPKTCKYGCRGFDKKLTAIALSEDRHDMVATLEDVVICVRAEDLPLPTHDRCSPSLCNTHGANTPYTILQTTQTIALEDQEARLNEAAVDPVGRLLFGSMTFNVGSTPGKLYSLRPGMRPDVWDAPKVHDSISVTNGMAWAKDGSQMFFTDSHRREIQTFHYDLSRGAMTNCRVFSRLEDRYGYPDGLCLDDQGGVWSARWEAGKVVRLHPATGQVDIEIDVVNTWNVTCCVFGGQDLGDLYITTAASHLGSDPPSGRMGSGKLYVVSGLGFRGVERGRFRWN